MKSPPTTAGDDLVPPGGWCGAKAPRIAPMSDDAMGPVARALALSTRRLSGGVTPNLFRVLFHSPRLFWPWLLFASQMMPRGKLEARHREFVVLRVAWNCRSHYEWHQHLRLARLAGVKDAEFAQVAAGPAHPSWGAQEAVLLLACDELHHERFVADATWARLRGYYDDERLVEFLLLVGHYEMLAGFLNSAGTPIEP